jgi:hypothetical protein
MMKSGFSARGVKTVHMKIVLAHLIKIIIFAIVVHTIEWLVVGVHYVPTLPTFQ